MRKKQPDENRLGTDEDDGTRSQYDVARELGVSRARIKQIEQAALAKLRKRAAALGLGPR